MSSAAPSAVSPVPSPWESPNTLAKDATPSKQQSSSTPPRAGNASSLVPSEILAKPSSIPVPSEAMPEPLCDNQGATSPLPSKKGEPTQPSPPPTTASPMETDEEAEFSINFVNSPKALRAKSRTPLGDQKMEELCLSAALSPGKSTAAVAPAERYTIVLDLDETVVYARDGPVHPRPHVQELFRTLEACPCEVIVWTAGDKEYAANILRALDRHRIITYCIYRHRKWFREQDYTKDLKLMGRPMSRVLIIENTADCLRENPSNGILVPDFNGPANANKLVDRTLLAVAELVKQMCESGQHVPEFLSSGNSKQWVKKKLVSGCSEKLFCVITKRRNGQLRRSKEPSPAPTTPSTPATAIPTFPAKQRKVSKGLSRGPSAASTSARLHRLSSKGKTPKVARKRIQSESKSYHLP